MQRFTGRVALVTGGSRGIGRATALHLAGEGADVAIGFFRDRVAAEKTVTAIEETGGRALAVRGHVGDPAKVRSIVDEVTRVLGPPTIIVSNAASGVLKPVSDLDEKAWDWSLDVNARALLLLARAALPGLRAAGGGSIVALSSLGSSRVLPGYAAVGASKAALESVIRYLAVELARDGVRANIVSAGVVDTDALRHFPARDEMLARAAAATPAGRMVRPEDVADAVAFLCSDEAAMIRGHTLVVDGGYSLIA